MIYRCLDCNYEFRQKNKGWYPNVKCLKCNGKAKYKELLGKQDHEIFVKKFRDVTALGFDKKTGQPFWLSTKGKRIRHDSSDIRYDLIKDPRGWKATGKKVKYQEYGEGRW